MRLGTKLSLYIALIIVCVLAAYGYFHVLSRRNTLTQVMQDEARRNGATLKVLLEKISMPQDMAHVQEILDSVSEPERNLGVIFYDLKRDTVFCSRSLTGDTKFFVRSVKESIERDHAQEESGVYGKIPVFSFSFPLKDRVGNKIGGISILQRTSFVEKAVQSAKHTIFIMIFVLISISVTIILFLTRRWVTHPIGQLIEGIKGLAKGDLSTQINLRREDELSELARAFNQMAAALQKAQDKLKQETESKLELERNLRHSEKLATIGQLASELAHEIGNPLNIIGGRAELARRRLEDRETALKNLGIIIQQTEKITRIIQQLLGFVRKRKSEPKRLELSPLLETILDILSQQIEKQGVRIVKDFPKNLPAIKGDSDKLQQVFLNLILNALQAMASGGRLVLAASCQSIYPKEVQEEKRPYLEVVVKDTGPGMSKEVKERIFDPFFTTKNQGTGLGLTVSQGILHDHEGWIAVESEIGKGSAFKVYLPILLEDAGNER